MGKPRRSVQFQHRGSNNHEGRRQSISEMSEGPSEPGSPIKLGINGKLEVSQEEVRLTCPYQFRPGQALLEFNQATAAQRVCRFKY